MSTSSTTPAPSSAASSSAAPSSSASSSTPSAPRFGGLAGPNLSEPWIGGKPKDDYSGTTSSRPATVLCYVPADPSKYSKIYLAKTSSSSKLFDPSDKSFTLASFATDVWIHLQKYGMDTVFYFKDQSSGGEMIDIINNHPRFSKSEVAQAIQDALLPSGHYGQCDFSQEALADSGTFIYNSLTKSMQIRLQTCFNDPRLGASGPVLWMALVEEVQSNSYQVYKQLVKEVESLALASFNGENVSDYCLKMKQKLETLSSAKQLPPDILLTIINAFTTSSVEDFRVSFIPRRAQIEKFIRESQGKAPSAITKLPNYTTYHSLLDDGLSLYRSLYDSNKWGPAAVNANSGKLARSGNRNRTKQESESLDKPESTSKHPDPKNPKPENQDQSKEAEWKSKAPKSGEPQKKTVNGREWNWCAKCSHWRVGHDTSSHKDLPTKPKADASGSISGNLALTSKSNDDWVALDKNWGSWF